MSDEETPTLILHTPMPLMPLTQMVADMGQVIVDVNGKGESCCFYGWGEAKHPWPEVPVHCPPHHLVTCHDNVTLKWLAATLKSMGHEVVVTDYQDWSIVSSIMPMLYEDAHQH